MTTPPTVPRARAWTDAAIRVRDAEYAEARLFMPGGKHPGAGTHAVAEVIPPERPEPLAPERLSAHGLAFRGDLIHLRHTLHQAFQ